MLAGTVCCVFVIPVLIVGHRLAWWGVDADTSSDNAVAADEVDPASPEGRRLRALAARGRFYDQYVVPLYSTKVSTATSGPEAGVLSVLRPAAAAAAGWAPNGESNLKPDADINTELHYARQRYKG